MNAPPRMRTLRAAGLCARVWTGGAPPVVCFPPAGGDGLGFRALAAMLAPESGVIAVDPPGHGGSTGPLLPDVRATANLALDLLGPALTGPVVLLGSSFGGYVAYETARLLLSAGAQPADIRLVICAAAAPTTPVELPGAEASDDRLIEMMSAIGGLPAALQAAPALLEQYLPMLRSDLTAYADYVRGWVAPRRPLPCPTVVVGGATDPIVPVDRLIGWRSVCWPTRLRVVAGGHHIARENPTDLAAEIRRELPSAVGAREGDSRVSRAS